MATARLARGAAFVAGAAWFLSVGILPTEARPHAPFALDGDEALCREGSPVVNCGTATGEAGKPYLIENLEVAECLEGCQPVTCANSFPSMVVVCNVQAHLVLRNITVVASSASAYVYRNGIPANSPVALSAMGTFDMQVDASTLRGPGPVLHLVSSGQGQFAATALHVDANATHGAATAAPPAIYLEGTHTRFEGARIDVAGRSVGILALPSGGTATGSVAMDRPGLSLFAATIEGPATQGLQIDGYNVSLRDTALLGLGLPRDSVTTDGTLVGAGNTLDVRRGQLLAEGVQATGPGPIAIEGVPGWIRFSKLSHLPGTTALAVASAEGEWCAFSATLNDIPEGRVTNHAGCRLDATQNWWRSEPRTDGTVATDPVLKDSIANFPTVTVATLPSQGAVEQAVRLEGHLEGSAQRIHVSGPGVNATTTPRDGAWSISLDLANMPYGTHELAARACNGLCYKPTYIQLTKAPAPRAPIAKLAAAPVIVNVGQQYTLEAGGSFSPDGHALTAYRFDAGDWTPSSRLVLTASMPGDFNHTLVVRDSAGLSSLPARATVRVLPLEEAIGSSRGMNAAGTVGLLPCLLAMAVLAARGRKGWR